MENADIERRVAAHYTRGGVAARIKAALGLVDAEPGSVRIETLFPVDQLHHEGVGLTEKMAAAAGIHAGLSVLDAGSGIGGPARILAHRFGCTVEALDLSDDFVTTARELDRLVGLTDRIAHRTGSVTALPFADDSFDVVWSQNVTMNVPDKAAMFAEARRVLRPGGVFVLSHIGEGEGGAPDYPLPWAMTAETSFALSPGAFLQRLAEAGFDDIVDHAADTPPPSPPPKPPEDVHAMGEDMPVRRRNTMNAVADGRLVPMLMTARRR